MASMGHRGIMEVIFAYIPTQLIPSPAEGFISAAACSVIGEDESNKSRLADTLLSNIVSRLPIKDTARTAVLAPRLGLYSARPQ